MGDFLYMGVDGGGTGCRARLTNAAGDRLGEGRGGPANIRLGLDVSWAAILAACDQALAQAGLDRDALSRTHVGLGLAGICRAEDERAVEAGAPARFASVTARNDAHTACLGAFDGADGAILIAGTGSIGYALVGGIGRPVGGWGFEVSDEGSGAHLGREAARAALRGHDGLGPHTPFTLHVLTRLGGDPAAVVAWAGAAKPGDYGTLAPLTLDFAAAGDPVATQLVETAAGQLTAHVRRLVELGAPKVCLMGGLAPVIEPWLAPWARRLLVPARGDALDGGLHLARAAAGLPLAERAA
ncbi:BadF/BadG/BcrA/BcrD ATPase family protein [Nitrospirillum sp. BR 11163]|uniref:BadF/BadG/BcrA/BcrD ATPase family protein n=1 Tax=Nitrospirillum sp. BR 11163 TaxID=3104323 RepID=UPI002AFE6898|nr:BadF/BadG/BcrA/BcrD ATPase family protein [Nitrospirillum sp. BR 11163]MEA1675496.1 BadF/BadG/BcrA/BcrD ATPase family protein [Nitrospirillum sp. BR 11163]